MLPAMSENVPDTAVARSARMSLKRARILFDSDTGGSRARRALVPPVDKDLHRVAVARRVRMGYPVVPADAGASTDTAEGRKEKGGGGSLTAQVLAELREERLRQLRSGETTGEATAVEGGSKAAGGQLVVHREVDVLGATKSASREDTPTVAAPGAGILALPGQKVKSPAGNEGEAVKPGGILVKKSATAKVPTPKWHAPWRLTTVLSSHLGWVRSVAFDPTNDMFATGGADRVIKIFDLAKACVGADDALKITLTGHISPIRGLAFSPRHPYLFSAGEDKMVKCWDLETNQVVRHYHGHLSGVFSLKLHPTLDLLVTGGRDAVARVWDMRTKRQVHCLTGHDNTVGAVLTKSVDPQVITGSYDTTIKLWDLAAGKCMTTLTHHKKSVRALCQPSFENTFLSGAADALKKWQGRDGRFIKNFTGHQAVVNALAVNDDGVILSAGDNGTMNFWDYGTGYCFQRTETVAQPGSLDAENGIFAAEFDLTGTRLITCEADKTVKIWKEDDEASEMSHPIDVAGWRKKCLSEAKQRF
mmetsp:Transcript_60076/g.178133  ORF Transcript_60076/g.178133 Transcript_60076/m.178133 type:complete len:533 (-) Transcript_60076:93-1691(-)